MARSSALRLDEAFSEPLDLLGDSDHKFHDVYTPQAEIGREKIGVSESLLSGAEEYFSKFKQYDYVYWLLQRAIATFPEPPSGLALDIGSGFGNTVIPLLENFPNLSVIATDISPDLLAILRREVVTRGYQDRCSVVAMDAHGDYFKPEIADNAFGCAVLHHMIDPLKVVSNVLKALKPGGRAVFFEPFEPGHAVLRIAYSQILAEAKRRYVAWRRPFRFLGAQNRDIEVRTHRKALPGGMAWENVDDKWMFTREHFQRIADALKVTDLKIERLHPIEGMFENQTRVALKAYGGVDPDELPKWAWDILKRFDDQYFSPEQKNDLVIEGQITFVR
jgi:SAM-dependent methyltransferase